MSTNTDDGSPEEVLPNETDDEQIIHELGQLRAGMTRLNQLTTDEDVPFEVSSQVAFLSSDVDTLAKKVAGYICGDDGLPDVCPVCGDPTRPAEKEFEEGESYDVEKMCVVEKSSLGVQQSIIHYEEPSTEK